MNQAMQYVTFQTGTIDVASGMFQHVFPSDHVPMRKFFAALIFRDPLDDDVALIAQELADACRESVRNDLRDDLHRFMAIVDGLQKRFCIRKVKVADKNQLEISIAAEDVEFLTKSVNVLSTHLGDAAVVTYSDGGRMKISDLCEKLNPQPALAG